MTRRRAFAWLPVLTMDSGCRWLTFVYRQPMYGHYESYWTYWRTP